MRKILIVVVVLAAVAAGGGVQATAAPANGNAFSCTWRSVPDPHVPGTTYLRLHDPEVAPAYCRAFMSRAGHDWTRYYGPVHGYLSGRWKHVELDMYVSLYTTAGRDFGRRVAALMDQYALPKVWVRIR